MRPTWRIVVAVLVSGVSLTACSPGVRASPPNIILITIDTLRADRLGSYGHTAAHTPSLDGLAAHGARFEQAVAHAPLTVPSHVSILTGQYPSRLGARDNGTFVLDAGASTVASLLRDRGYRTGGFVGAFLLSASFGFDRGFAKFDDELPTTGPLLDYELRRSADVVAARAGDWIRQNSAGPFFAWIHFYDVHTPYAQRAGVTGGDAYDGAVSAADAGVGSVLKTLDELGLRSRTATIVTADHGEGLGDHGEREHGLLLYDSVMRVPLIVDVPGGIGRVIGQQARHIDLLPTILALAGAPPAPGLPGRNLLPLIEGRQSAGESEEVSHAESWYGRLHFGWSTVRSVRGDGWKYIEGARPQLYDLRRDPGERTNLVTERAALAARLKQELETPAQATASPAAPSSPDAATMERLRALGYVSGSAPAPGALAHAGADPEDMLPQFERYVQALNGGISLLREDEPAEAVVRFRQLAAEYPDSYEAHHYLGYALSAANRNREAVPEYRRALQISADSSVVYFNLAKALSALGQHAEARASLQRGFALEPRSFYGEMIAGVAAWNGADDKGAVAAFSRAVALNPVEPRAQANLAEACMRSSDLNGARRAFEALIALGFQPAAAHYNLGVIAERQGDIPRARLEYRQALALNPQLEPARIALKALP